MQVILDQLGGDAVLALDEQGEAAAVRADQWAAIVPAIGPRAANTTRMAAGTIAISKDTKQATALKPTCRSVRNAACQLNIAVQKPVASVAQAVIRRSVTRRWSPCSSAAGAASRIPAWIARRQTAQARATKPGS